jgi:hypothetical protein
VHAVIRIARDGAVAKQIVFDAGDIGVPVISKFSSARSVCTP